IGAALGDVRRQTIGRVLEDENVGAGLGEFFPIDVLVVADVGFAGDSFAIVVVIADGDDAIGGADADEEIGAGGRDRGDARLGGFWRGRVVAVSQANKCGRAGDERQGENPCDSRLTHRARMVDLWKMPVKPRPYGSEGAGPNG